MYVVVVVLRGLVVVDIGHRDPLPVKQIRVPYKQHRQRSTPAKPNHFYSITVGDIPQKWVFCASHTRLEGRMRWLSNHNYLGFQDFYSFGAKFGLFTSPI